MKTTVACLVLILAVLQPAGAVENYRAAVPEVAASDGAAAGSTGQATGAEQAEVNLEQAIVIARSAFAVPESLEQFSNGFSQNGDKSFWELHWYSSKQPGGDMNVRVNAATGEVWSMYRWLPAAPGQEYQGLPKYTREQAEDIAAALAEKLQPERFRETSLQPANQDYIPLTLKERGPVEYTYNYARRLNGVLYRENSVTVGVSGDTGEVVRFEVSWEEDTSKFPSTGGSVLQTQAEQVFRKDGTELIYFRPSVPAGKVEPLKLVYQLSGPQRQVVIDAFTGELRKESFSNYYGGAGGGDMMDKAMSKAVALTPAEEAAVGSAKNLLSREKALAAAQVAYPVPREYVLSGSNLSQDYLFRNEVYWRFNWQAGDEPNRKTIDVAVDAVSGELISFDRYNNDYDYSKAPDVKFSEETARKIAEDFIDKAQPGKKGQIVFDSVRPELGPVISSSDKPMPRAYNFNWVRQTKGVKFPANGFYLNVDSTTGVVKNYRMTWWDVEFPEPQGLIGQEAAAGKYLLDSPLTLSYMRLWSGYDWKGAEEPEVSLVYYLSARNFSMLDAFTGQPLDSGGHSVTLPVGKVTFSDLADSPAREAVEMLARYGIVDATDGHFRPNEAVTQAELVKMLVMGSQPSGLAATRADDAGNEPWYQRYYEQALLQGIIQPGEKPDPDAPVTREFLARLLVDAKGYSKVAKLSDIYLLNFQDAGEVSANLRGHVAISAALGLLEPVAGKFEPQSFVTRADAAMTVWRLLKSGQ